MIYIHGGFSTTLQDGNSCWGGWRDEKDKLVFFLAPYHWYQFRWIQMMWDPPWQCHKPRIWSNLGMVVTIMFTTLRSIRLSSQRKAVILTYSDPPRWGCGGKQEVLVGMWPCFAAHAPSDQASEDVERSQIVRDSWMMAASFWAGTPWEHGKAMVLEVYVHLSPDTLLKFCKRPWLWWCLGYPLFFVNTHGIQSHAIGLRHFRCLSCPGTRHVARHPAVPRHRRRWWCRRRGGRAAAADERGEIAENTPSRG